MMPSDQTESAVAVAESPSPSRATRPEDRSDKPAQSPWWNVVLLDDDDHSYEYVICMMQTVFAKPIERAFQMAKEVDSTGRVICATVHKELAELKRDQILAFGRDPLIARCKGSMSAEIEPAIGGGDDDHADGADRSGRDDTRAADGRGAGDSA
jgi:ATP-dependent Clp protease adaptor protein ClpS